MTADPADELLEALEELERADETVDRIRRSRNRAAYKLSNLGYSFRGLADLARVSPERVRQWAREHEAELEHEAEDGS